MFIGFVSPMLYHRRIDFTFLEKMAEATRKCSTLKSDLQASKDQHGDGLRNRKGLTFLPKLNVPARKMQDLKLAFSEFYLSLILLQNYQNLNFTGFRKILKKHDKVTQWSNQLQFPLGYFFYSCVLYSDTCAS